jgi:hypothetical protein
MYCTPFSSLHFRKNRTKLENWPTGLKKTSYLFKKVKEGAECQLLSWHESSRNEEKKEERNRRLSGLFLDYFPNAKRLNMPDFGRIQGLACFIASGKVHYVN